MDSRSAKTKLPMTRVAGYARVSTALQANEGTSPEQQKMIIREECTKNGWELVRFYSDFGVSGKNSARPGLNQLRKDAKDDKFDMVMFTKLDRLGRDLRDLQNIYYEISEQNGIEIRSIEQPELNTKGIMGRLLISILGAFAEFERSMIQGRTQGGRKVAWKQLKSIIGSLPFGYIFDKAERKIIINQEQKAIYDRIVAMYLDERLALRDIVNQLNAEAIKSPGRYGNRWNHVTVGSILKNEAYTGRKIYNTKTFELKIARSEKQYFSKTKTLKDKHDWVIVDYPQFISEDRFKEIRKLMESKIRRPKRKPKNSDGHFLLDSNLLYCGECGGKVVKQHNPNGRYDYYCYWKKSSSKELQAFNRERCIFKTNADALDAAILSDIIDFLSSPGAFAKDWLNNLKVDEMQNKIDRVKQKIEIEEGALGKLYDRWVNAKKSNNHILEKKVKDRENALYAYKDELLRTQRDYETARADQISFEEFEKLWHSTETKNAEKIRVQSEYRARIADFITSLPFDEQKRIIEAVISPETGGKITVSYTRPSDIDNSPSIISSPDSPLYDDLPEVECHFRADLSRISNLIQSLDRNDILCKVSSR